MDKWLQRHIHNAALGKGAALGTTRILQKNSDETREWVASTSSGSNTGDVTLAGETYLSIVGQVITAIAINLASQVTGRLPFANLTAATAASRLLGRGDSGAGDYQEITLGTNLSMSGTTLNASGGSFAPTDAQYVTLATNGTLTDERVLTGTSNQITVTDGGAGTTVTLSTPQNIHTAATPQFARIGLGGAADSSAVLKLVGQYYSPEVTDVISGATLTVNWDSGTEHYASMTANVTTLTLQNEKSGGRYVLILKQDATGSRTMAWPASILWSGGTPVLSTGANKVDLFTFMYSGALSKYIGNYQKDFV